MDKDQITERLEHLGEWERRVLEHVLHRRTVAQNTNEQFDEQRSLGDRLADRLAAVGGSWAFLLAFATLMLVWIMGNQEAGRPFDPFPYILLNLVLSCLAAVQAPVILMSQNRQTAKDRLEAHHDYAVNLKSEVEVLALHAKVDIMRDQHLAEIRWLLDRVEKRLAQITQEPAAGDSSSNDTDSP